MAASPSTPPQPPHSSRPAATSSSSSSRIPTLLEPHVACGPLVRGEGGSLTVVTWVQGASANWLVLRYLYALLGRGGGGGRKEEEDGEGAGAGVVLGMDLDALRKSGRFIFVDGLCTPHSSSPDAIKATVDAAAARLAPGSKTTLLIDGLDAYIAMTPTTGSSSAESLIMRLREDVHATLLTLAADEPLVRAAVRRERQQGKDTTTGLERVQAALVVGQAHAADQVVSLRRLDTGAAADVSGVLRVVTTAGEEGEELLYHVAGDGAVRVFERGA